MIDGGTPRLVSIAVSFVSCTGVWCLSVSLYVGGELRVIHPKIHVPHVLDYSCTTAHNAVVETCPPCGIQQYSC